MAQEKVHATWNSNGKTYRWRRVWHSNAGLITNVGGMLITFEMTDYVQGTEYLEEKTYLLGFIPKWKVVMQENLTVDMLIDKMSGKNIMQCSKLCDKMIKHYQMTV